MQRAGRRRTRRAACGRSAPLHSVHRPAGDEHCAGHQERHFADANALLDEFLEETNLSIAPISDKIGELAVACFATFGKGRHAVRLNLGDCLSYACAKAYRAPLLFNGDDFSPTDIAWS
jgi:ribonuclease VapC